MNTDQPFSIEGVIQDYAWGGYDYLANLTGLPKEDPTAPWAELWIGGHPKGPAKTPFGPLDQLIAQHPAQLLGARAAERWDNRLPFLFKILDVKQMLSIQAHPNKAAAEAGFAREESVGPARFAPNRNYRDDNHKPELGLALTDFYLLHGFRQTQTIEASLREQPGWEPLLSIFQRKGIKELYGAVMTADQASINQWLSPLASRLKAGNYPKGTADFWAQRAFQQYTVDGNYDRGIFSIYWFNLVHLRPGQAIYQAAGIPHAYLEGVCVEVMANSDNVLRGGLTIKHIDVPELMNNLVFDEIKPAIIEAEDRADGWSAYATPAPDFRLMSRRLKPGEALTDTFQPVAIYFVLEGTITLESGASVTAGSAVFKPARAPLKLTVNEQETVLFRATANGAL